MDTPSQSSPDVPPPDLLAIVGPTASGKTGLAVRAARLLGGEIISADSRQVYRGMDIGTGKDLHEYAIGGRPVPVHMIDIVDPSEPFSVFDFQGQALECIADVRRRKKFPVLCGGTGLYVDSLLRNYRMTEVPEAPALRQKLESLALDQLGQMLLDLRPDYHTRSDLGKKDRLIRAIEIALKKDDGPHHPPLDVHPLILLVTLPRAELRQRIRARLEERVRQGLIEEVARLRDSGLSWERLDSFGLEYRFVSSHLKGELGREEMIEKLFIAICQFAKRQDTWFRGMERKGVVLHRIERADPAMLDQLLKTNHLI